MRENRAANNKEVHPAQLVVEKKEESMKVLFIDWTWTYVREASCHLGVETIEEAVEETASPG